MKKKKINKLILKLSKELALTKLEISKLNYVKKLMAKDNQDLKQELAKTEELLNCAESALNYKEMRENDNAGFTAKIISNIVRE